MHETQAIEATQQWLKLFVIGHNLCPFAHKEFARKRIHYAFQPEHCDSAYYDHVVHEIERLIEQPHISTSLLIWPMATCFEEFLSLVGMAEHIIQTHGWHHSFQLAHFHPNYCFAETSADDASNYTNRSPFPMLHLLRVDDMAGVLAKYPNPESIPERNIRYTIAMGSEKLKELLKQCSEK